MYAFRLMDVTTFVLTNNKSLQFPIVIGAGISSFPLKPKFAMI